MRGVFRPLQVDVAAGAAHEPRRNFRVVDAPVDLRQVQNFVVALEYVWRVDQLPAGRLIALPLTIELLEQLGVIANICIVLHATVLAYRLPELALGPARWHAVVEIYLPVVLKVCCASILVAHEVHYHLAGLASNSAGVAAIKLQSHLHFLALHVLDQNSEELELIIDMRLFDTVESVHLCPDLGNVFEVV